MKKLCIALTIAALAGCKGPSATEINRPSLDTGDTRQLMLITTSEFNGQEEFASASYSDGTATGFGPGILITCNSSPIVDTRKGITQQDTVREINFSLTGVYEWSYSGPDTNFVLDMPTVTTQSPITITEPRQDTDRFPTGSLTIAYEPAQPGANIQVVLVEEAQTGVIDTILPVTRFDSTTGIISPIPLGGLGLVQGSGEISIDIQNRSAFSSSWIHSIVVEDSITSRPIGIEWQ